VVKITAGGAGEDKPPPHPSKVKEEIPTENKAQHIPARAIFI
jgi:hypothetical protein